MCRNISTKQIQAAISDYKSDTTFTANIFMNFNHKDSIFELINRKYINQTLSCAGKNFQFDAQNIVIYSASDCSISPFVQWIEITFEIDFDDMMSILKQKLTQVFYDVNSYIHNLIDELYLVYKTGHDYSNMITFVSELIIR